MTEIEKLYENAGIKGEWRDYRTKNGKIYEGKNPKNRNIRLCKPRFTAEKQIELIKWLCQKTYRNYIHIRYERDINNWKIECNMVGIREFGIFDECFAGLINALWQSLTNQEKEEIRRILNENS